MHEGCLCAFLPPRRKFPIWSYPFCMFFLLSPHPETQLTHVKARGQEINVPQRKITGRTRKSKALSHPSVAAREGRCTELSLTHASPRPSPQLPPQPRLPLAQRERGRTFDLGLLVGSAEWPQSMPRAAPEPGGESHPSNPFAFLPRRNYITTMATSPVRPGGKARGRGVCVPGTRGLRSVYLGRKKRRSERSRPRAAR